MLKIASQRKILNAIKPFGLYFIDCPTAIATAYNKGPNQPPKKGSLPTGQQN
jgi:hypothetical protein